MENLVGDRDHDHEVRAIHHADDPLQEIVDEKKKEDVSNIFFTFSFLPYFL